MPTTITVTDFFSGLFSALELKSTGKTNHYTCGDSFNRAIKEAFNAVESQAKEKGIKTGFDIVLHPIYNDSSVIEQGLSSAIRRDIISLENPRFQRFSVKIEKAPAEAILNTLPGDKNLYFTAASVFENSYFDPQF